MPPNTASNGNNANIDPQKALRLRVTEPGILDALKERARKPKARDFIIIPDENGEPMFGFWIRALDEPTYQRLTRQYSPPRRDPDSGMELPGDLDVAAYRTAIILEATEPDDRKALWQNPELREAYGAFSENQLVEKMLGGPGMKLAVITKIDRLARYGVTLPTVERLEELLGNSSAPAAE